jgi:hypothetical protein
VAWLACAIRNPWLRETDRQTPQQLLGWEAPKSMEEVLEPEAAIDALYARQKALGRGRS